MVIDLKMAQDKLNGFFLTKHLWENEIDPLLKETNLLELPEVTKYFEEVESTRAQILDLDIFGVFREEIANFLETKDKGILGYTSFVSNRAYGGGLRSRLINDEIFKLLKSPSSEITLTYDVERKGFACERTNFTTTVGAVVLNPMTPSGYSSGYGKKYLEYIISEDGNLEELKKSFKKSLQSAITRNRKELFSIKNFNKSIALDLALTGDCYLGQLSIEEAVKLLKRVGSSNVFQFNKLFLASEDEREKIAEEITGILDKHFELDKLARLTLGEAGDPHSNVMKVLKVHELDLTNEEFRHIFSTYSRLETIQVVVKRLRECGKVLDLEAILDSRAIVAKVTHEFCEKLRNLTAKWDVKGGTSGYHHSQVKTFEDDYFEEDWEKISTRGFLLPKFHSGFGSAEVYISALPGCFAGEVMPNFFFEEMAKTLNELKVFFQVSILNLGEQDNEKILSAFRQLKKLKEAGLKVEKVPVLSLLKGPTRRNLHFLRELINFAIRENCYDLINLILPKEFEGHKLEDIAKKLGLLEPEWVAEMTQENLDKLNPTYVSEEDFRENFYSLVGAEGIDPDAWVLSLTELNF